MIGECLHDRRGVVRNVDRQVAIENHCGERTELVGNVVTGVAGAFVGGYIQKYAKFDFMQLGNPLLEQLAIATMGAIVVILLARTISPPHARR